MFTFASFPAYLPSTDVQIAEVECRVFASGDDRKFWDVQVLGTDDRWHTAPDDQAKSILAHIETNDVSAWGDIMATARTNPTLAA